ncbi:uncharacterized protein LOC135418580 [Pseudopipra pipra]|uniref:uncharacterized protein LOC135418580 n=1 Tax=Pseudopipra pipra TaxID=415032 RepID=UPI003138DCB3
MEDLQQYPTSAANTPSAWHGDAHYGSKLAVRGSGSVKSSRTAPHRGSCRSHPRPPVPAGSEAAPRCPGIPPRLLAGSAAPAPPSRRTNFAPNSARLRGALPGPAPRTAVAAGGRLPPRIPPPPPTCSRRRSPQRPAHPPPPPAAAAPEAAGGLRAPLPGWLRRAAGAEPARAEAAPGPRWRRRSPAAPVPCSPLATASPSRGEREPPRPARPAGRGRCPPATPPPAAPAPPGQQRRSPTPSVSLRPPPLAPCSGTPLPTRCLAALCPNPTDPRRHLSRGSSHRSRLPALPSALPPFGRRLKKVLPAQGGW